jgi:hypothetical protein
MWGSIEIIDPNSPSSPASEPNPAPIPDDPTLDTTTPNPLKPLSPNKDPNKSPIIQEHAKDIWKPIVTSLGVIVGLVITGFILYKNEYFKITNNVESQ